MCSLPVFARNPLLFWHSDSEPTAILKASLLPL
jgi:hypothetical protein